MERPCVRVPRESGEETRQRLAAADLIDRTREIVVEDGWLYVPVESAAAVPGEYDVVARKLPTRERQRSPEDLLGWQPTYERLGDVVLLDEDDPERAREAADAIVASDLRARSVLNRASEVRGELRVREWDVLVADAADPPEPGLAPTEAIHREYGHEFLLDVTEVYFSPRLATERHRVVEQASPGECAFDMFAGVGPFAVPLAARGADVVAVDLNERAVEYLCENARRNGAADRVTAVHGDVREVAGDYGGWADRIVMNLPHSADAFVESAVAVAGDDCTLHFYDIQHEDDPFGPGLRAIEAAAGDAYDVEVRTERVVRSYAPHELNVCLDVRLTR